MEHVPMTTSSVAASQTLRDSFKFLNRFMLLLWRLGFGKWLNCWPALLGRYLVIVHTGRKTGQHRYTSLNYAEVDGEIYCTAGFGYISDWYKNIRANPEIEAWLPDGWWCGAAEDITDAPDKLRLLRQVLIGSGFAAVILAGIQPKTISDQDLATMTDEYRLIHIRRVSARTGSGGPGEWDWVWPLAALLLALLAFRPRKK
jgi:deazaflavin-dependent oxidoreductase (nitroreductase family)